MGGLFSKNDEEEERKKRESAWLREQAQIDLIRRRSILRQQEIEQENLRQERLRQARLRQERLLELYLQTEEGQTVLERIFIERLKQHKVAKNLALINNLRRSFRLDPLDDFPTTPYKKERLSESSADFRWTQQIFKRSNKPYFKITEIFKVGNTFLLLLYKLAHEKCLEYDDDDDEISENIMFHGTKFEYLHSICSYNFDRSKVINHKFGHGVSFATNSFYSTHYHRDNMRRAQKVMILAKVFYGTVELGSPYTVVPEEPSYTTINEDGSVYVKYDDASFYPEYIVHYEGIHPHQHTRYMLMYD